MLSQMYRCGPKHLRFVTSVLGVQVMADYNNYALYSGTFLNLEKIEGLLGSWYVQTVLYGRGWWGFGGDMNCLGR